MTDDDMAVPARQHARDIDRLLGYLKQITVDHYTGALREPQDSEKVVQLDSLRDRLMTAARATSGKDTQSIDDLVGTDPSKVDMIKTPKKLPRGYSREQMREDLIELQHSIDGNINDGYFHLIEPDYELVGTIFTDVADLQRASALIQAGEYDRAAHHVTGLDTLVRDEIPVRLYDMLYHR